jgi:hypothetical protein
MARLTRSDLIKLALIILEELAAQSDGEAVERPPWLRIVLAFLCDQTKGDPGFFRNFWTALASPNQIGRQQGVNAALNGIYRQLGRER